MTDIVVTCRSGVQGIRQACRDYLLVYPLLQSFSPSRFLVLVEWPVDSWRQSLKSTFEYQRVVAIGGHD